MTTASDMTLFHYVSIWQSIIIALYLFLCMGLFFCRAIYFIQFPYFQYLYFHIELMWMWFSPCVALGQMVFSLWLQNHSFVRSESIGRSGRPNLHSEAFSISAFQCLTLNSRIQSLTQRVLSIALLQHCGTIRKVRYIYVISLPFYLLSTVVSLDFRCTCWLWMPQIPRPPA